VFSGRKAARNFMSRREKQISTGIKDKKIWTKVSEMIRVGFLTERVCNKSYSVYGSRSTVTGLIME
jgi:hypothetical protein